MIYGKKDVTADDLISIFKHDDKILNSKSNLDSVVTKNLDGVKGMPVLNIDNKTLPVGCYQDYSKYAKNISYVLNKIDGLKSADLGVNTILKLYGKQSGNLLSIEDRNQKVDTIKKLLEKSSANFNSKKLEESNFASAENENNKGVSHVKQS